MKHDELMPFIQQGELVDNNGCLDYIERPFGNKDSLSLNFSAASVVC